MNTISIKKSTLSTYRGLGLTSTEIAAKYGITEKEVKSALETFGLVKKRAGAKVKEVAYVINLVDDSAEFLSKSAVASSVEAPALMEA